MVGMNVGIHNQERGWQGSVGACSGCSREVVGRSQKLNVTKTDVVCVAE